MDEPITEKIIGAAIEVHRHLGPGLLESAYEECLAYELDLKEMRYQRQKPCPLLYKNTRIENAYRIDFLIEDRIIVEIKSLESLTPLCTAQLLTYLRLLNCRLGLLLNFNVPILKDGIKRIIL